MGSEVAAAAEVPDPLGKEIEVADDADVFSNEPLKTK